MLSPCAALSLCLNPHDESIHAYINNSPELFYFLRFRAYLGKNNSAKAVAMRKTEITPGCHLGISFGPWSSKHWTQIKTLSSGLISSAGLACAFRPCLENHVRSTSFFSVFPTVSSAYHNISRHIRWRWEGWGLSFQTLTASVVMFCSREVTLILLVNNKNNNNQKTSTKPL